MSHGVNFGQDRPKPAIEAKSWSHVFPFIYGQELTKRAARYRDMSQELIVIVSIIAAATFSLGFFAGYAVRAMISRRRRRYSRR
jgi:hypothetical protein